MKSSNVQWVELRELISRSDERNTGELYTLDDLRGISIQKKFIDSKANMDGVSLAPYKLVKPNYFCYVTITSRNSDKITLALNTGTQTYIVSSSYEVFYVSDEQKVLPEYIYLWFCRPEFDRYARFNSWGSAREAFAYEDMERVRIPLPSIDEQRTIVDAWKSLRNIKEQNESLATPLMQLCQSYIQDCKHKFGWKAIGKYIKESDERNINGIYTSDDVRGVSIQKVFINTKANMEGVPVSSYKVVRKGMFAFNPNTARMGDKFSIALNQDDKEYLVSSIYPVFEVCPNELEPAYLKMWFNRIDFDRYARYNSWGSAREMFNFSDMQRVEIPLPPIEVQRAVVALYQCALEYKAIAAEADAQARSICSALMQHAINS